MGKTFGSVLALGAKSQPGSWRGVRPVSFAGEGAMSGEAQTIREVYMAKCIQSKTSVVSSVANKIDVIMFSIARAKKTWYTSNIW